jgi:hypothetical protein
MGNESSVNVPVVTQFVREVIGCNCADEVFRHIEVRRGSSAVQSCPADYELRIGGRLMIVVTSEAPEALSAARLGQVFAEGMRARDKDHFNRFRLVVQAPEAAQHRDQLLRAFEAMPKKDEKTHLHVVEKGEVPEFLQE